MPRQLKLMIPEMGGVVDLYLIYQTAGVWEEEWRSAQHAALDLPKVSKEIMDHALIGWTRPLVQALGPEPKGRLRLLPTEAKGCEHASTCSLYIKEHCGALLKKMPWCYEPKGMGSKAAEVIKMWRDEVYVVVVEDE